MSTAQTMSACRANPQDKFIRIGAQTANIVPQEFQRSGGGSVDPFLTLYEDYAYQVRFSILAKRIDGLAADPAEMVAWDGYVVARGLRDASVPALIGQVVNRGPETAESDEASWDLTIDVTNTGPLYRLRFQATGVANKTIHFGGRLEVNEVGGWTDIPPP